jgi:hypothetical protein
VVVNSLVGVDSEWVRLSRTLLGESRHYAARAGR